jgi:hypothetical protein
MKAIMLESNSLRDEIIRSRNGTGEAMTILDGMNIHDGESLVTFVVSGKL